MASYFVRKDSPYYWIRIRRPDGSWGQRSSGLRVADKGSLRKIQGQTAQETASEAVQAEDGSAALFNRWVPGWIEYKYTHPTTRESRRTYWSHLATFLNARRIQHPQEVTYAMCHDYAQWRTSEVMAQREGRRMANINSVATELSTFRVILGEAVRRGWILTNPCSNLRLAKVLSKPKRAITRAEEKRLFKALTKEPQWMGEAFLVAMRQGCRLTEVQVPMTRIDLKAMSVLFRIKGGRDHAAPLHKDLLPLVRRAKKEGRKRLVELGNAPSRDFIRFFKREGLDLCFHCTRVTVVTRLCEAGFSESQTMAYVGHSSSLVHSLYRKMRPVAIAHLGDVL